MCALITSCPHSFGPGSGGGGGLLALVRACPELLQPVASFDSASSSSSQPPIASIQRHSQHATPLPAESAAVIDELVAEQSRKHHPPMTRITIKALMNDSHLIDRSYANRIAKANRLYMVSQTRLD
jgi:hypothetical protein